ncbi:MAG: pyruvate-flavodoxin oxidoreductase, partial [Devosia sp.]|nr:pyruvate-flavodoxin oxidoreductase [Devosia sp.]
DKDWATGSLEYVDADGTAKLLEYPVTPADFAAGESRFKKHFKKLKADAEAVPVAEFIELSEAEREGKTAFVWSTDDDKHLIRLSVSATIIHLVQERRKYWRTLQYLAGKDVVKLDADHAVELAALKAQYAEAVKQRESSIDQIARGMSQLASSSKAPANGGGIALDVMPAATTAAPAAAPANGADVLVSIAPEDQSKCTNCKTCYQDLSDIFEKTRIVVDGAAKEVARIIPGALERVTATPELKARIAKIAANSDAEIIRS